MTAAAQPDLAADLAPDLKDESIGDLLSRLADDGGNLVRAEIELYRQTALRKVERSKPVAIFGIVALMFGQAGLTVLLIGIGALLARWLGLVAGIIIAAMIGFVLAGIAAKMAVDRLVLLARSEDDNAHDGV
jgi:hypothetical protein